MEKLYGELIKGIIEPLCLNDSIDWREQLLAWTSTGIGYFVALYILYPPKCSEDTADLSDTKSFPKC